MKRVMSILLAMTLIVSISGIVLGNSSDVYAKEDENNWEMFLGEYTNASGNGYISFTKGTDGIVNVYFFTSNSYYATFPLRGGIETGKNQYSEIVIISSGSMDRGQWYGATFQARKNSNETWNFTLYDSGNRVLIDCSFNMSLKETTSSETAEESEAQQLTYKDGILTISGRGEVSGRILSPYRIQDIDNYLQLHVIHPLSDINGVVIEYGITSIGDYAFYAANNLKTISLSNSITSIGAVAFYDCDSLESIIIPNSVISIGRSAFASCDKLKSVSIPVSVTSIGDGAFDYCDLTINYEGTEEQWNSIAQNNKYGEGALEKVKINYNKSSQPNPSEQNLFFIVGKHSNSFVHSDNDFGAVHNYEYDENGLIRKDSYGHYIKHFDHYTKLSDGSFGGAYPTTHFDLLKKGLSYEEEGALLDEMYADKWGGSCQGLAMSLAMAYLNRVDLGSLNSNTSSPPECYYELKAPKDNTALRDIINYYHLLQYTPGMPKPKGKTVAYNDALYNVIADNIDWGVFWSGLREDAKKAQKNKIPLLLSFAEGDSGHAVLICGIDDSDSDITVFTVYDENSYNSTTQSGEYYYLILDNNKKSFWFSEDDKGETIFTEYPYRDAFGSGKTNWMNLKYWDSSLWNNIHAFSSNSSNSSAENNKEELNYFTFSYKNNFKITNDEGLWLNYNPDNGFSGNMNIKSLDFLADDTSFSGEVRYTIGLERSGEYRITDLVGSADFSVLANDYYTSVRGDNINTVTVNTNDISVIGSKPVFVISTTYNKKLVRISSEAEREVKVIKNAEDLIYINDGKDESDIEIIDGEEQTTQQYLLESNENNEEEDVIVFPDPNNQQGDNNIANDNNKKEQKENKFTDVPSDKWYTEAVYYCRDKGYMAGKSNNKFDPNGTVTRATITQVLYAMEGKPAVKKSAGFKDLKAGSWYVDSVNWAASIGIVSGYSKDKFGPNDAITRQQMAAIMYQYAKYKKYDTSASGDISKFKDSSSITKYAVTPMKWAVGHGIISGTNKGLEPKGTATRAQIAVILQAFDKNIRK